jgi:hypothetical protein
MSELKPYHDAAVKIPSQVTIDVSGTIDILPYPLYGTLEEKSCYIKLIQSLSLINMDESIIA